MDDEQRRHLEQLRRTCTEHLRVLEGQAATFGAFVPPYIVTEIKRYQQQIADIDRQLGGETAPLPTSTTSNPTTSSPTPAAPFEVFISYAHEDSRFRARLDKHLANLQNQGMLATWYDGEIVAGEEWEPEILEHLNTAQIILLLISADFMASKYINTVELQRAVARHEAGQARVIPILLKPVDYRGAPFAKLEALPTDANKRLKAITEWSNREQAYARIAEGIRRAVEQLTSAKHSSRP